MHWRTTYVMLITHLQTDKYTCTCTSASTDTYVHTHMHSLAHSLAGVVCGLLLGSNHKVVQGKLCCPKHSQTVLSQQTQTQAEKTQHHWQVEQQQPILATTQTSAPEIEIQYNQATTIDRQQQQQRQQKQQQTQQQHSTRPPAHPQPSPDQQYVIKQELSSWHSTYVNQQQQLQQYLKERGWDVIGHLGSGAFGTGERGVVVVATSLSSSHISFFCVCCVPQCLSVAKKPVTKVLQWRYNQILT